MGIIGFLEQKYLKGQKERQARKLTEVRKGLRKMQSGSPPLRSIAKPELARVDELRRQLRKVRSREDLRQWRSLYEMCQPAFEVALSLSRPRPGTIKRRAKSSKRK
jgi:hypothetical protein